MTTGFKQGERVVCFPGTEDETGAVVLGSPIGNTYADHVRVVFFSDGSTGLVHPQEIARESCSDLRDDRTLRDEFAMAALTGLLSDHTLQPEDGSTYDEFVKSTCESAYDYADAMMEARK